MVTVSFFKVVNEVVEGLNLQNVKSTNGRAETINDQYDFIISRAVAQMETFVRWVKYSIAKKNNHKLRNCNRILTQLKNIFFYWFYYQYKYC